VIREDRPEVSGRIKAPDYCFRGRFHTDENMNDLKIAFDVFSGFYEFQFQSFVKCIIVKIIELGRLIELALEGN